jgi:hypothetical protein
MKLPYLSGWERSSHSLHAAAQLLGAIRQLVQDPVQNYLELALRIERNGLSTGVLPSDGMVLLDWKQAALVYTPKHGAPVTVPLAEQSQGSLLEALLIAMHERGDALVERTADHVSYTGAFLAALDRRNHVFKPKPGELIGDALLHVDPQTSAEYGAALYHVFTAVARFRARLAGPQTPIVVWPEHFDLSTLWFPTDDRSDDAPSMNFGFSPFDATTERPYLYAYAYPMPDNFAQLPLPAPAQWHTEGWNGAFVAYDDLIRSDDPEVLIESLCEAIYALLAPTLR